MKFWSLERFRHSGVCSWCGLENQLTPTIWNTIQAQWNQKAFPNEKIFIDNISSGNFCLQGKSVCQLKNATWVNLTLELKLQKSVVKFIYLYFNTRSLPCSQKATAIPQTVRLYTWTPFMVVRIYHKRLGSPRLQCEKKILSKWFF